MDKKRNMLDDFEDCRGSKQRKITDYFKPKQRKITDYFKFRDSPHKIWHVAKKGQMQNLITRFPQLTEEIFGLLDYQTLVKCREVNENWYNAVTNQRIYWTQMIIKYTNSSKEYHKQWMKAIEKAPFEILKKLAELARDNCSALKDCQKYEPEHECDFFCVDQEDEKEPELSLFNILASESNLDLFKYVAGKVGYKHTFGTRKDKWSRMKYSPLHEAVSRGNFEICKFIIDQVDDKNPANNKGHTPFHIAANYRSNDNSKYVWGHNEGKEEDIRGHFDICQLIFERTGFQNPSDDRQRTPLHYAASHGNLEICKMIIEKVDNPNPLSDLFYSDNTPLHLAARKGHLEICKLIVENSKVVNKNPRNIGGETPLHFASDYGHFEICQLLIDIIEEKNPRDYDYRDTPLHNAAENDELEICKLIIGKIGEKNPANENGTTPLHHAAKNDNLEICQLIIDSINGVDKENPINDNDTISLDFTDSTEGAEKKNPRDKNGTTPLHFAAKNCNLDICKLICQNVKDKNPKDKRGRTPLDIALDKKDLRILYLLIGENNLQF